ncbi:ESPR domain-containing protein [Ursidibacter arcticus]
MNKIFKVIFDRATQSFVVVSELAKSKGKSASKTDKRVMASVALAVASALSVGEALAANNADLQNRIHFNNNFVSMGQGATTNGNQSVVIGAGASIGPSPQSRHSMAKYCRCGLSSNR